MLYVVYAAADIDGAKVNLEFTFPTGPSVAQILNRCIEAFGQLLKRRNPDAIFSITTPVIFNDAHQTWDRLERSSQLTPNAQLYLFQPDTVDLPGEIPPPMPSEDLLRGYRSPPRGHHSRSSSRAAVPDVDAWPEPVQSVYSPQNRVEEFSGIQSTRTTMRSRVGGSGYNPEDERKAMVEVFRERQKRGFRTLNFDPISIEAILEDERKKQSEQAKLSLDEYRGVVRAEARDFSPSKSPERE